MMNQSVFFRPGGTLDPGAECYIARKADAQLLSALLAGEYVFLLDSRQKGKSSLIARGILKLREGGVQHAKLDLQRIGANVTPEQWYAGLAVSVGQELGLHEEVLEYWRTRQVVGPLTRFLGVLQDVILTNCHQRVVIFVDEVDFVRALPFLTDEFFAGIRECFNRRASDDSFKRLTFCLVGVATPGQLIRNPDISPFNIGVRIELTDFSLEETLPYAASLNNQRDGASLVSRVHHWVSGHPYLTQLLCGKIAGDPKVVTPGDVDRVVRTLLLSPESRQREPNLADVERRILEPDVPGLTPEERRIQVLELYGRMLKGAAIPAVEQNPVVATLRLSGIGLERDGELHVRNRVYRSIFDETWRRQNLPDAEERRQRTAARRAVFKTSSLAAVIILVIGCGAYAMWRLAEERQHALAQLQAQSATLQRQGYAGLMASVCLALSEHRYARNSELLKASETNPLRGWEWGHAALYARRYVTDVTNAPDPIGVLESQPNGSLSLVSPVGIYDVLPSGIARKEEAVWEGFAPKHRRGDWRVGASHIPGEFVFLKVGDSTPRWKLKTKFRMFDADPDRGTILATQPGGDDAPFSLVSIENGKAVNEYFGPTYAIAGRFLHDGSLLSVHQAGHVVRRRKTGEIQANAKMGDVEMSGWGTIALSYDGSKFIFYDRRYRHFEIRDSVKLTLIATTKGPLLRANACSFSRDGTMMVIGGWDGVIYVFDTRSGSLLDTFAGHRNPVLMVEFCDRDRHLASIDNGGRMLMWPIASPKPVETYNIHPEQAESAMLVSEGQFILSSSAGWISEKTLCSRNMKTGEVHSISGWRSFAVGDANVYVSMNNGSVAKLDRETLKVLHKQKVFDGQIGEVHLVARGTRLFVQRYRGSSSKSNQYAVLEATSLREIARIELPWPDGTVPVQFVNAPAEGDLVVISSEIRDVETLTAKLAGMIYVVSAIDGKVLSKLRTDRPFTAISLTPGARHLVVAFHETGKFAVTPTVFEARSLKLIGPLATSPYIDRLKFSRDGRFLAGFKLDGRGFLWNMESRKLIATVAPGTLIRELDFSPDGERIITSSTNRDTKIWSTIHQDELMTLRYEPTRNEDQNGAVVTDSSRFSEDGTMVIMACTDGNVRVFNSLPWRGQSRVAAR